ncbi:aldose epimerase family protein [Bacillus cereus]
MINVENTPFDFRNGKRIICGVKSEHPQNKIVGGGYDHPFLLSENKQQQICLIDRSNGRKLVVETDEPCVVLYTGNMLGDHFQIRVFLAESILAYALKHNVHPTPFIIGKFASILLEKDKRVSF